MNLILKFILSAITVFAFSKVLPGVSISSWQSAAVFTLVFGVMNITVKPLLQLFMLPITCLTLGLFLLIINMLVVKAADFFVDGFYIHGWTNALIFSVCMSLATSAIEFLLKEDKEK
jgi:putative membrane protein